MPEDTLPNFTDKVVTFYVADAPRGIEAGIAMEHVEFERLGDRLFAIGRVPEMAGSEWVSHLQSAIAWDSVVHYLVFESRDDFRTRMAKTKSKALGFLPRGAG